MGSPEFERRASASWSWSPLPGDTFGWQAREPPPTGFDDDGSRRRVGAPGRRYVRGASCWTLCRRQVRIHPALPEQLVMRAALHDPSVVQYQDLIRSPHGREAMRDDDSRASQSLEVCIQLGFRCYIEVAAGFVEQ
jgi:hypothetical protein